MKFEKHSRENFKKDLLGVPIIITCIAIVLIFMFPISAKLTAITVEIDDMSSFQICQDELTNVSSN